MPLPTGISQRTWSTTSSEVITTGLLRANVTNPVWLLTSPPMAVLQQTASSTSVPDSTATPVNMDTETLDSTNGHSDTANPARWYAAVPGWYLIKGAVCYSATTSSAAFGFTCSADIYTVSSASTQATDMCIGCSTSGLSVLLSGTELCVLNAPSSTVTSNDWVRLYAYQQSGSTIGTLQSPPQASYLMPRWVATVTGTTGLPVPANPGFADTSEITGAWLNTNMRDTINYLSFPPMARLSCTGPQNMPSQTFADGTPVTFHTASAFGTANSSDNYGGWSGGTRYVFPQAGRYYVYGQVAYTSQTGFQWAAGLRVNSRTTQWGTRMSGPATASFGQVPNCEAHLRVNAGDYVELLGTQNSGSNQPTMATAVTTSKLIILWEGA